MNKNILVSMVSYFQDQLGDTPRKNLGKSRIQFSSEAEEKSWNKRKERRKKRKKFVKRWGK